MGVLARRDPTLIDKQADLRTGYTALEMAVTRGAMAMEVALRGLLEEQKVAFLTQRFNKATALS